MKKLSVMALIFVLTATLFAGCRRNPMTTGPSTTPHTTTTTHATTLPHTTGTHPSATGVLPSITDPMPESTGLARHHRTPRY